MDTTGFKQHEPTTRGYCRATSAVLMRVAVLLRMSEDDTSNIGFFADTQTWNFGHNNPQTKKELASFLLTDIQPEMTACTEATVNPLVVAADGTEYVRIIAEDTSHSHRQASGTTRTWTDTPRSGRHRSTASSRSNADCPSMGVIASVMAEVQGRPTSSDLCAAHTSGVGETLSGSMNQAAFARVSSSAPPRSHVSFSASIELRRSWWLPGWSARAGPLLTSPATPK